MSLVIVSLITDGTSWSVEALFEDFTNALLIVYESFRLLWILLVPF